MAPSAAHLPKDFMAHAVPSLVPRVPVVRLVLGEYGLDLRLVERTGVGACQEAYLALNRSLHRS